MLPPVRRQYPEHIGINRMPIFLQFPDPARHPLYVVQDHHIGDEVIVLDDLALFMPDVFGDCAVTAEHQPLREVIELLTLVGRRVNGPAQFGIVQIFQQEQRANDTTEFPERKVELVLCGRT
jgi:dTDP-glucose pyrophosphorylase